jgi:hypothetical protein
LAVPIPTLADPAPEGIFGFALGAIALAFVIFITAKGELATYLSFFLYTPPSGGK